MKKIVFATAVAIVGSFAANAQGGNNPQGDNCSGCTALTYDVCQTHVTVSLANTLSMNCDNCNDMQACANSISEWTNGINLGTAQFSVASTKAFSVYAGTVGTSLAKAGGGTSIPIGTGPGQISIKGKVQSNNMTGGTIVAPFTSATALASRSGNTAATAGSKVIAAANATLVSKSAQIALSTGPLPLNVASGDYSVDVVIAAIQD